LALEDLAQEPEQAPLIGCRDLLPATQQLVRVGRGGTEDIVYSDMASYLPLAESAKLPRVSPTGRPTSAAPSLRSWVAGHLVSITSAQWHCAWMIDITCVPTWSGFLYLAVVLDVFSRRIVGWAMADHLRTELVISALDMALWNRRPERGVIHHAESGRSGARCQPVGWSVSPFRPPNRTCASRRIRLSISLCQWVHRSLRVRDHPGGRNGRTSVAVPGDSYLPGMEQHHPILLRPPLPQVAPL